MMMVPTSVFDINSQSKTLLEILGPQQVPKHLEALSINNLRLDSREVESGDVFIALRGGLYDGKQFIGQAIEKGAAAVLVDAEEVADCPDLPLIIPVAQLNERLSTMADNFFDHPSKKISVVGVTGTNGKTSCSQYFAQAAALLNKSCGVIGTNGVGVLAASDDAIKPSLTSTGMTTPDPITVQRLLAEFVKADVKYCVIEVSSHGLVQHRVAAVDINTAIFTNISHDHLDYHGSMKAYAEAKAELFCMASVKNAIVNIDDDYAAQMIEALDASVNLITYSLDNDDTSLRSGTHFCISDVNFFDEGKAKFNLCLNHVGKVLSFPAETSLVGQFNLSNVLAITAALYAEDFNLSQIVSVINNIQAVKGRMEAIDGHDLRVVVDFAHTPDALEKALLAIKPSVKNNLWCVFGCGGDRDKIKRPEMAAIAEQLSNQIVVTSDNPRTENSESIIADINAGFSTQNNVIRIVDRVEAIDFAISQAQEGDVILIAGKGHEEYQIIGDKQYYFSDQEQAKVALAKRKKEALDD